MNVQPKNKKPTPAKTLLLASINKLFEKSVSNSNVPPFRGAISLI